MLAALSCSHGMLAMLPKWEDAAKRWPERKWKRDCAWTEGSGRNIVFSVSCNSSNFNANHKGYWLSILADRLLRNFFELHVHDLCIKVAAWITWLGRFNEWGRACWELQKDNLQKKGRGIAGKLSWRFMACMSEDDVIGAGCRASSNGILDGRSHLAGAASCILLATGSAYFSFCFGFDGEHKVMTLDFARTIGTLASKQDLPREYQRYSRIQCHNWRS